MDLKEMAAREAVKYVEDGMVVGLGSGSTASIAIRLLGDRVKEEGIEIIGIPTSRASDLLGRAMGIKIAELDDHPKVDITIDGADEVGPALNLIKGLGGALVREKIVAGASMVEMIVVDESKLVDCLGSKAPLPVEIVRYAHRTTMRKLASLGCTPQLRMKESEPFVSDNGNFVVDCAFGPMKDPAGLETKVNLIPGVVDNGLFIGLVAKVVIGTDEGVEIRERPAIF